jgi:F-box protein 42
MNLHPPAAGSFIKFESTVDDLPDEVLEYILSLVAPYKDLQECSLVCKRWNRSVKSK